MTALCGGGASQAKPGAGTAIVMSGGAIGALLANVPTPWAVAFAALVSGVTYDLTTMCATDPPALPVMTGGDMLDLTIGPAGGTTYLAALTKFYQFIKYWAWFQFCECSGATTPAPAAPPAAPTGLPQTNPPLGGLPAGSCWDKFGSVRTHALTYNDMTSQLAPNLNVRTGLAANVTGITTGRAVPSPLPTLWTTTLSVDAPATAAVSVNTIEWDATGAFIRGNPLVTLNPGDTTLTLQAFNAFAPTTAFYGFYIRQNSAGADMNATARVTWQCPAGSGVPATPCCPPDPIASGLLTQILQAVTLIQRQAVPFAYVPGSVHAGLSGAGTIAISGILGASVSVTTLPAALGRSGSTPLEIFDAGFITFGTPDGYPTSYRLEHNPQLMLPARCSAFTQLAYDLHPGVVVTVTELLREP